MFNQFGYPTQQQQQQQFDPLAGLLDSSVQVTPQQGGNFNFGVAGTPLSPQFGAAGGPQQQGINPGQYQQGLSNFGKFGVGVQAGSALLNGYLGFQQLGLAKKQLNFQKDSFNKNYANQAQSTNRRLEDRQAARVAANPNSESVESYLRRNRVS